MKIWSVLPLVPKIWCSEETEIRKRGHAAHWFYWWFIEIPENLTNLLTKCEAGEKEMIHSLLCEKSVQSNVFSVKKSVGGVNVSLYCRASHVRLSDFDHRVQWVRPAVIISTLINRSANSSNPIIVIVWSSAIVQYVCREDKYCLQRGVVSVCGSAAAHLLKSAKTYCQTCSGCHTYLKVYF